MTALPVRHVEEPIKTALRILREALSDSPHPAPWASACSNASPMWPAPTLPCPNATRNSRDFEHIKGLRLHNPWADLA